MKSIMSAALAGAALLIAMPAAAQTVSGPTGVTPFAAGQEAGGVRYRELSCPLTGCTENTVFLGARLGTVGGPYVFERTNYNQNGANPFSLTYDAGANTLTSVLNGDSLVFNNFRGTFPSGIGNLDTLSIQIADRETGGLISVTNLVLNGSSLSQTFAGVDNGGLRFWSVTGFDYGAGFTLTGNINLSGTFGPSAETNRVEFLVGSSGAIPEPATWAMLIGGFGLVGSAMRRRNRAVAIA